MLERFLQVTVLILLAMGIAAMMEARQGISVLNSKSSKMVDDISEQLLEDMRRDEGAIATGGDPEALQAAHDALLANAAMPGEARRHNDRLNVALLTFETRAELGQSPMAPITMDVSRLNQTALLLVSDEPVAWTLAGASINQRAKVAFEGRAPVAAANMRPGMLAGTRIQGFDANRVISTSAPTTDKRGFCNSMKAWAGHFGVKLADVAIFEISLQSPEPIITATDRTFLSRHGKSRRIGTAASLCRKK